MTGRLRRIAALVAKVLASPGAALTAAAYVLLRRSALFCDDGHHPPLRHGEAEKIAVARCHRLADEVRGVGKLVRQKPGKLERIVCHVLR